MSITPDWIKVDAPNKMGRCSRPMRKLPRDQKSKPEVNSRDVIKWTSGSISMLISVTITDIWTIYDIELKHHTINMPNLHDLKIQDGGGRHLGFWNMSIPPNWIDVFAQNLVGRCITAMRIWHMTKSRNRKFIHVTSLNECREHRCDDVKAYRSSQLTGLYFKLMQNTCSRYCLGY